MSWFLIIIAILMGGSAFIEFEAASTSIQQIIACTFGISAAVLFSAGCVIIAIDKLREQVTPPKPVDPNKPVSELDVA